MGCPTENPAKQIAGDFFSVEDWEFELDLMSSPTREQLQSVLEKAPPEHETARFLKSQLMQAPTFSFTPFTASGELCDTASGGKNA